MKRKYQQIVKEWKEATPEEVWEGIRDNFIYGFLGAILIVFVTMKTDVAVLAGYLVYYLYVGKIVNRQKYVTDLGKMIVFPIPSTLGAFTGYKLSLWAINYLNTL